MPGSIPPNSPVLPLRDSDAAGERALNPDWRYHFLGIGGVGMSAIAEVLHQRGYHISGSDITDGPNLRHLGEIGIPVNLGHKPEYLDDADAVVFTTAIGESHPIWSEVGRRNLQAIHRSEALGAITREGKALAVAGTHGKTTSTACLAAVLEYAGWDPTALVGGHVPQFAGRNLRLGKPPWIVVEADESDGSFARLLPWAVLLTNIDADHLDRHGSLANIVAAFGVFLERLKPGQPLVYCADDPNIRALVTAGRWSTRTFGTSGEAEVRVEVLKFAGEGMRIRISREGNTHEVDCRVAGVHNAVNLAGVFTLATEVGMPEEDALRGIAGFGGVARRQQYLGSAYGCRIYDDYAHHPTEVRATLDLFRENHGDDVTVIFQPHLYSRTAYFAEAFAEALRPARRIILTDIYAAREDPLDGVSSQLILEHLTGHPDAIYLPDWHELLEVAQSGGLGPGVLITMGAGDITELGPLLLEQGGVM